jgi:ABC-type multidrug transport system ATPase subunit/DNA-binding beta-propeller fold protein YncE
MTDRLWTLDRVTLAGRPAPRLADVSLVVRPGVTAVVGYSGAGKTSLLNVLVGYERSDVGRVTCHVAEELSCDRQGAVRAVPRSDVNRSLTVAALSGADRLPVFWGPQDDGLWPKVTARRHLELVLSTASRETADELLDGFDLTTVADATPERLSRGEASRLSVARAIASGAAVLVLDEPLAHVDPARRSRYWDRLLRYVSETGASLVFASHEPADVLRYADHAVGLRDGKVVFDGEARALYESAPDEAAALLLGPVNWLPPEESARWRTGKNDRSPCIRPERLDVEPADDGPIAVVASRTGGPLDETDLRCDATGEVRRFVHRPAHGRLEPGVRVRLTVLGLLAVASLVGCLPSANGPELEIASERRFALPATGVKMPAPRDIAIGLDDEKVVLDNAGRVLVYSAAGKLVRQWDMPESADGNPEGACVLPDGRVVVADTHYYRVVTFDPSGKVVSMFGERGEGPGQFIYPVAVTIDPAGNLYVAEYGGNDRIQKFGPDGKFLTSFGSFGTGEGQFQRPSGTVWLDGKLYVVDAFNSRVHVFADSGEYKGLLGAEGLGLHYPYDLSLGPDGRLYAVEYGAGRVTALTTEGEVVGRYGKAGHGKGEFATPWGLAVDSAGRIWVADTGNRRIAELIPAESEAAVTASLGGPR